MQAPSAAGVSGHALDRLRAYLDDHVPVDEQAEAEPAFAVLGLVRQARNAQQHSAAAGRGLDALNALGVYGPPFDWATAWDTLAAAASDALMDLRAVIARLQRRP
jgi:hypothetical protein